MGIIEDGEVMARLDERVKNVSDDIREIKDSIKSIKNGMDKTNDCILKNKEKIADTKVCNVKIEQKLKDHLSEHERQHKRDITVMGIIITVITITANAIFRIYEFVGGK